MTPDIDITNDLIEALHRGQSDRAGKPYVRHPRRVARNVSLVEPAASDDMIMAALLHDTLEDCGIDEGFLREKGYSADCIEMVRLLTKPEGDPRSYAEVIEDLVASGNRGAMIVKIADNMDNLHPHRAADFQRRDPGRATRFAARYRGSIERLCIATGTDKDRIFALIREAPPID